MMSQGGGRLVTQLRRIDGFQGLGHASMQPAPPRAPDLSVGHLTKLVVAEVILIPQLSHDAPPPQFVQTLHQGVFVGVAGLGQHIEGEGATNHGRQRD